MLVTFITVLISANRVSHLNIVSAIRDLPEPPRPPSYLRDLFWRRSELFGMVSGLCFACALPGAEGLADPAAAQPAPAGRLGILERAFHAASGIVLTPVGLRNANLAGLQPGSLLVIIGAGLMLRGLLHLLFRRLPAARPGIPSILPTGSPLRF